MVPTTTVRTLVEIVCLGELAVSMIARHHLRLFTMMSLSLWMEGCSKIETSPCLHQLDNNLRPHHRFFLLTSDFHSP